jgi:Na+/H+ antiporter NhaD/arsenite permease-like protein
MLQNFGWKAAIAVSLNAAWACFVNREELSTLRLDQGERKRGRISNPILLLLNAAFLVSFILFLSSPKSLLFLLGLFAPYLWLTREEQGNPKPLQGLLVGFFLAGLLILTSEQGWWLSPLIESLGGATLFLGASLLTGITDNAALTSLAAQVQGLSENARYLVVAGAVTGGGLTLIANAPNPVGFSILKHHFEGGVLHSGRLLIHALLPTLIAGGLLWIH